MYHLFRIILLLQVKEFIPQFATIYSSDNCQTNKIMQNKYYYLTIKALIRSKNHRKTKTSPAVDLYLKEKVSILSLYHYLKAYYTNRY